MTVGLGLSAGRSLGISHLAQRSLSIAQRANTAAHAGHSRPIQAGKRWSKKQKRIWKERAKLGDQLDEAKTSQKPIQLDTWRYYNGRDRDEPKEPSAAFDEPDPPRLHWLSLLYTKPYKQKRQEVHQKVRARLRADSSEVAPNLQAFIDSEMGQLGPQAKRAVFSQGITRHAQVVQKRKEGQLERQLEGPMEGLLSSKEYLGKLEDGKELVAFVPTYDSAIDQGIELSPLETAAWITEKSQALGVTETLELMDRFAPVLNLYVGHYNSLLHHGGHTKEVLEHMAKNGIKPDRQTVTTILETPEGISAVSVLDMLVTQVRLNLDAELIELLIRELAGPAHAVDTALTLLLQTARIYRKYGAESPASANYAPLDDRIALDYVLCELSGAPCRQIVHHAVRPTPQMFESVRASVHPDAPIVANLDSLAKYFS